MAKKEHDGKPLLSTAFKLFDTHGLPLSVTVAMARNAGFGGVDIPQFYLDARKAGWSEDKALVTIREALFEDGDTDLEKRLEYLRGL